MDNDDKSTKKEQIKRCDVTTCQRIETPPADVDDEHTASQSRETPFAPPMTLDPPQSPHKTSPKRSGSAAAF